VTYERVRAFKTVAIASVGDLVDAIAGASALDDVQASDLVIAVIAMAAPLWQAGHPAETLTRLYVEEPAMAHIGIDFEPTLTRLIAALCNGMSRGSNASSTAHVVR
jgi:hypothetical protein